MQSELHKVDLTYLSMGSTAFRPTCLGMLGWEAAIPIHNMSHIIAVPALLIDGYLVHRHHHDNKNKQHMYINECSEMGRLCFKFDKLIDLYYTL